MLPVTIALYGSQKKWSQTFQPLVDYFLTIPSLVQSPSYRVNISEEVCDENGEAAVSFAPMLPLSECAKIDVLIIKISVVSLVVRRRLNDLVERINSMRRCNGLASDVVVIEPLVAVDRVACRWTLAQQLHSSDALRCLCCFVPATRKYTMDTGTWESMCGDGEQTNVSHQDRVFLDASHAEAVVVKPLLSNGPSSTHAMLVASASMTSTAEPNTVWQSFLQQHREAVGGENAVVVQSVVHTSSVVYKVYVIGDHVDVAQVSNAQFRAKTCHAVSPRGDGYWTFHSQDKSLFAPVSERHEQEGGEHVHGSIREGSPLSEACRDRLLEASRTVRRLLGLDLLGFDVVMDESQPLHETVATQSCPWYILDVNFFPSFKQVPDAHRHIVKVISDKVRRAQEGEGKQAAANS